MENMPLIKRFAGSILDKILILVLFFIMGINSPLNN